MSLPVTVVGIGADGWDGLSPRAQRAVTDAEVLMGSTRQLGLVPESAAKRVPWPTPMVPALPALFDEHRDRRVCVLASGDPMFHGVGVTLCRVLGPDRVRVIAHPSSVSLACARLGWPLHEVPTVSLVNRPVATLAPELRAGARVLVLSNDQDTPAAVADLLREGGFGGSRMVLLEQLGGPTERLHDGTADLRWFGVLGPDAPADDALDALVADAARAVAATLTRPAGTA